MKKTRSNEEWLGELSTTGLLQAEALSDLREILLRACQYSLGRRPGDLAGSSQSAILQLAEDCAQESQISVLHHLQDFRGESKFTTWAYKFAINIALTAARRERWKGVSLQDLIDRETSPDLPFRDQALPQNPELLVLQQEAWQAIREVILRDLTVRQRQILKLMVFNEVPMDEVVRHFGSNRNAVYKLLHDSRRKLKQCLQARGFEIEDVIALFGAKR